MYFLVCTFAASSIALTELGQSIYLAAFRVLLVLVLLLLPVSPR